MEPKKLKGVTEITNDTSTKHETRGIVEVVSNTGMKYPLTSTNFNKLSESIKPVNNPMEEITEKDKFVENAKNSLKTITLDNKNMNRDNKISEITEIENWPTLTVDDINISFKVVGDLQNNTKLKIIDNKYLAADDSYLLPIVRYNSGQSRKQISSFLQHLFVQTKNNAYDVLAKIRNKTDIDININILSGLLYKLSIFLHRYENMREVYKSDTSIYAILGGIRDNFFSFLSTFYRQMILN